MNCQNSKMTTCGNLGLIPIFKVTGSPMFKTQYKQKLINDRKDDWIKNGGNADDLSLRIENVNRLSSLRNYEEAANAADEILAQMGVDVNGIAVRHLELHREERAECLSDIKNLSLDGLEDYMGWVAVEPQEGVSEWDIYVEDAKVLKEQGIGLVAFLWIQTMPEWTKDNQGYVRASNVETGLETDLMSIFADETMAAYDRFYSAAARKLGGMIDVLRIGTPYDFGETTYPAGASTFAFPLPNMKQGFWANEAPARANYKKTMAGKYKTISVLNTAWGTAFESFDCLEYPNDAQRPRYWVDFVKWYHVAFTEQNGKIADISKKYFPYIDINLNLGWPCEKINLGQDISGLMKMGSEKGLCMRSPTGPMVPFLYTKRVATAARHYPPVRFSSEPIDGSATNEQIAGALFKDLTTGVNWHFDYVPNYYRGSKAFAEYMTLRDKVTYPHIEAALFYPTTSQFLENWDRWKDSSHMFAGGYPAGLAEYAEELRDMLDYDVVDERLVCDGFLNEYKYLIWLAGTIVEEETLEQISKWIENGGILLAAEINEIGAVEGKSEAFSKLAALYAKNGVRKAGKGRIIEISKDIARLYVRYPGKLDDRDGVLLSEFKDGILAFNRGNDTVSKKIYTAKGIVDLELESCQLQWIEK
jgi:hypothetical protein